MTTKAKNNENTSLIPVVEDASGNNLMLHFEQFEQQEKEVLTCLDATYLKMEESTTYNFIFLGIEAANIEGKEAEVARLCDKSGNHFLAGMAAVVSNLKKVVNEAPIFVRIETTTYTKSQAGNKYMQAKVFKL